MINRADSLVHWRECNPPRLVEAYDGFVGGKKIFAIIMWDSGTATLACRNLTEVYSNFSACVAQAEKLTRLFRRALENVEDAQ